MEQVHRKYELELDSITQDYDDDGTLTQGTAASRMSLSTIFTSTTSSTNAITKEDMDAFQRAVDAKGAELTDDLNKTKQAHRQEEDALQTQILELQSKKSTLENDRKRCESNKNQLVRELSQIGSQSSYGRVRERDVEEARENADRLAKSRDESNKDPRREEITREIRVLEDRLKSISTTIEQDTKIRDQLRLRADEQNEIDMLERQVNEEYDVLNDMIRENSYLISSQGENVHVTKENFLSPVEVLHNNVRDKHKKAEDEVERASSEVGDIQKKVSEKKALVRSHTSRFGQLQQKKKLLARDGGGVQKIKSVIRAIIREDKTSESSCASIVMFRPLFLTLIH